MRMKLQEAELMEWGLRIAVARYGPDYVEVASLCCMLAEAKELFRRALQSLDGCFGVTMIELY
jgi:hypothetical protein